ncbi:MAG: GNAT family N-acetyltransferase [Chitinophagaceae bacterium]|nr:GNAT family N-acetyltransferase [Chitinophagaceae bacterium]
MKILNSLPSDIDTIFDIYDKATAFQKQHTSRSWLGFERDLVLKEISEGRQWKIVMGDEIACVFVTSFNDPDIWKEKDTDPAVYLHRIATHPDFRGKGFVKLIVEWTKDHAKENGKKFIRMDTGSGNEKLNQYYIGCGFNYLGITSVDPEADLPQHYKMGDYSLFEIEL